MIDVSWCGSVSAGRIVVEPDWEVALNFVCFKCVVGFILSQCDNVAIGRI